MSKHVPVHGRSIVFYRDVVGLRLASEVSERNATFFWIGNSSYSSLHVAFEVATINDLLDAPKQLKAQGIAPLSFFGKESMEHSVIAWMPAAAIYF